MDDKELLDLAKGVISTPEQEKMQWISYWNNIPENTRLHWLKRKEIRQAIFEIRKLYHRNKQVKDVKLAALHEIIGSQLNPNNGISYHSFTWQWDVHPKDITKIILKEHWVKEGGGFDVELGVHSPTAFTKQEEL